MESVNQRDVTRNQSAADFSFKRIFIFDNRFSSGLFRNNSGGDLTIESGMLLVRDSGTFETASMLFSATPLAAAETVTIAGLTYTSTGATTRAELAQAFANLAVGATAGDGLATGTYTGTLTGYSTGGVVGNAVVFTATTKGNQTNLAASGTGALPTATIVNGSAAVAGGLIPATASNLADVIGISDLEDSVELADTETLTISYGTDGTISSNFLVLPSGVTLDTVVGNKTLADVLEGIGFHLESSVEHTKFDN